MGEMTAQRGMFESAEKVDLRTADPQSVLIVLDETGDTKIVWDAEKADEVENARDSFNKLRKRGYAAFAVKRDGSKGAVINEFDPDAEKIILSPPLAGG